MEHTKLRILVLCALALFVSAGCAAHSGVGGEATDGSVANALPVEAAAPDNAPANTPEPPKAPPVAEQTPAEDAGDTESAETPAPVQPPEAPQPAQEPEPAESGALTAQEELRETRTGGGLLVVIDPGHQAHGNSAQEPVGPGASETKSKVTSGTRGTATGIYEYEFNLAVSLLLRDELESRGYTVLMTRTTHDVDLSNAERAAIANDANADAFVRIHANGDNDPSVSGALTICQTRDNPYNGALYDASRRLSDAVLDALAEATGCKKRSVWETDTMSGINWCSVPTTIVEAGFMSNPDEDRLLATEEYRRRIALGVANGLDAYFGLKR